MTDSPTRPAYRTLDLSSPPDEETLNAMHADGYDFVSAHGPEKAWHAAGGLPGGLEYTYWRAVFRKA